MPILYILAGPNGAGKTTFYYTAVEQGFIDPALSFINVDLIIKNELGGFTTKNFAGAEELVRIKIGDHLRRQESFMIESNLPGHQTMNGCNLLPQEGMKLCFISYIQVMWRSILRELENG